MRIYESVFILRPDVPEEELDRFVAQMESVVTSSGGSVQKTEKWGRRRLAYEVRGHREGQYVVCTMQCHPPTVHEFERLLKVAEPVIKFQTVRIDEELKRLEKMRRKREKRGAARSSSGSGSGSAAGASHGLATATPPSGPAAV